MTNTLHQLPADREVAGRHPLIDHPPASTQASAEPGSRSTVPAAFDLASLGEALNLSFGPRQRQAIALGYAVSLPGVNRLSMPLSTYVDGLMADIASERRQLRFDGLARPIGFVDGSIDSPPPCASPAQLTRKKDLLDHGITHLCDLLAVGQALQALRAAPLYAQAPIGAINALVMAITATGQYRLYRDDTGAPVGLLSWAWLSTWTVERLRQDALAPLHPCEWNEGRQLYFRDIAASPSCVEALAQDLAGELFADASRCLVGLRKVGAAQPELAPLDSVQRPAFAAWLRSRFAAAPAQA